MNKNIIELLRERALTGRMEVRDKQLMLNAADELEKNNTEAKWVLEIESGMSRTARFKWYCSNCGVEPLNVKEEIHCHYCGATIIRKQRRNKMQMTIESKFNIGDIVYVADLYHDFYANRKPYVVKDVLVDINSRRIHIQYEVEQDGLVCYSPEDWTFATYEECVQWCKERN